MEQKYRSLPWQSAYVGKWVHPGGLSGEVEDEQRLWSPSWVLIVPEEVCSSYEIHLGMMIELNVKRVAPINTPSDAP
jgi:hypothetical protein